MKLNVVLGQDMSAYADTEIEVADAASKEEVIEAIRAHAESKLGDLCFQEEWSSACALRIVNAVDEQGAYVLGDVALEPSPFDAGQVLQSWLKGHGASLQTVINAAVEAKLIDRPVMETHRQAIVTPGGETIDVQFQCRNGATQEERDLAFFHALAQVCTLDCLPGTAATRLPA